MRRSSRRPLSSIRGLLLCAALGLSGLAMPAAANTGPQLYGFCWVMAQSSHRHMPGLGHYTTLVFPYDRWHMDEGRFFQQQFEAHARTVLGISKPTDQLVCEKEDTQDKAVMLFKARAQQSTAAGAKQVNYLGWVPTARPLNAVAVPPPAPAPAPVSSPASPPVNSPGVAQAPGTAPAPASAPGQRPLPPEVVALGALSSEESSNLAYLREVSCEEGVAARKRAEAMAAEIDAGIVERSQDRRGARRGPAYYQQFRDENAQIWRRQFVIHDAVRREKGCR